MFFIPEFFKYDNSIKFIQTPELEGHPVSNTARTHKKQTTQLLQESRTKLSCKVSVTTSWSSQHCHCLFERKNLENIRYRWSCRGNPNHLPRSIHHLGNQAQGIHRCETNISRCFLSKKRSSSSKLKLFLWGVYLWNAQEAWFIQPSRRKE